MSDLNKELSIETKHTSKQLLYRSKIKKQLDDYVGMLSSLDEMTFNIGIIINNMKSSSMKTSKIAEVLREYERFDNMTDSSLTEMIRVWGRGVHHLIKDYGFYGADFNSVKKALMEESKVLLTSNVIRNYAGDIALCQQTGGNMEDLTKTAYKNLDGKEAIEATAEVIEGFNEQSEERHKRIEVQITKPKAKKPLPPMYEAEAKPFIRIKTIPSVKSSSYKGLMKALSCCVCGEKRASDTLKLPAEYLPMSDSDSDLLHVPMCVSCKIDYNEGRLHFTQSEMSMLLFKHVSIFFQAIVTRV